MDFFKIKLKEPRGKKDDATEVYPDFIVVRSKDLMVQGNAFYAIWDEKAGLWSRDEFDVQRLVDEELDEFADKMRAEGVECKVKHLSSFSNGMWKQFKVYLKSISDNAHPLDTKLTFANTEIKRSDHVSRRLPYNLTTGSIAAYEELVDVLYEPDERRKIEWAIGAIISGDAKKIQKFLVFYGKGGTGKSTIMDIIYKLLGGHVREGGYCAMFDAKALVGNNNAFSTESFRDNPLAAIQHDGDLSKIEDNAKLNSIVSHEVLRVNEKYKSTYDTRINAFLFMGTNRPVQISDAKSGLIRRLIDVNPTGFTFEPDKYFELIARIDFELGAIAQHCLDVYKQMGKSAYSDYQPRSMMFKTDAFFNFIEAHYDIFRSQDVTTLKQGWELYKVYAEESQLGYKLQLYKFREKFKDYFEIFHDRYAINDVQTRSVYEGFVVDKPFKSVIPETKPLAFSLVMDETESVLDEMLSGMPAQYSNAAGNPKLYWDDEERIIRGETVKPTPDQVVSTVLGDLDTTRIHFLKVPEYHIVIDFDLKDKNGAKSLEMNREAASAWPATYAEISKSGAGVHLHYTYDGDASELASVYSEDIEIKVFTGNSSLRRKLTKCNNVAVATISSGLPFKKEKHMLTKSTLQTELGLRNLINKAMRKEIPNCAGTKPAMDFIEHILKQAYDTDVVYDVSDMMPQLMAFSNNSKKNADYCHRVLTRLDLTGKQTAEEALVDGVLNPTESYRNAQETRTVFFDCEVYPNLFVICWKYEGSSTVVRMINPKPQEVEQLFHFKLVGYNNRSYDNHIMWARMLGASNEDLYRLSQRLMSKDRTAFYGQAYEASYADVYDFSVDKKGLKKWEIELGIPHIEMDIPWDQPVSNEDIPRVVEYCCNDVNALEVVFNHLKQDFIARQILADLSGLTVNTTTRKHTTQILFGKEREPYKKFIYADLGDDLFPGYVFNEFAKTDKSTYRGETVGEGGYVYAEPGIHRNVTLLDIASMHPTSIVELDYFGPYTKKFAEMMDARLTIKNAADALEKSDFQKAGILLEDARRMLGGKLEPYLQTEEGSDENLINRLKTLAKALKLVLNSVYGYTAATFPNEFRDPRNKDNIVAKRGALFMVDLKHFIQEQGFTVAHIKTDSVKIPNATPEIIELAKKFGLDYGYTFEVEATYDKMLLANDAVYVAKDPKKGWTATGSEFKHPYIFKTLFSGDPIEFRDLCETKQVDKGGVMYLSFAEGDVYIGKDDKTELAADKDDHVGRTGLFVPVHKEFGGGTPVRIKDGKKQAVAGTKGYYWLEAEMIRQMYGESIDRLRFEPIQEAKEGTGSVVDMIDMNYFTQLAEDAAQTIEKFGNFEEFVS